MWCKNRKPCLFCFHSWLHSFVGRVLHHLRAFLSQAEKSREERTQTFKEINLRLQQLTSKADQFFVELKKAVIPSIPSLSIFNCEIAVFQQSTLPAMRNQGPVALHEKDEVFSTFSSFRLERASLCDHFPVSCLGNNIFRAVLKTSKVLHFVSIQKR